MIKALTITRTTMNVCSPLELFPVISDIGAGLLWGAITLGALLAIFTPTFAVSGLPPRLLVDLLWYYLIKTVLRIFIFAFSLIGPSILTYALVNALSPFIAGLGCAPNLTPGIE